MDEVIAEFTNDRDEEVSVYRKPDGLYYTYVNGCERQHGLDAESVIRWLAHTLHRPVTKREPDPAYYIDEKTGMPAYHPIPEGDDGLSF